MVTLRFSHDASIILEPCKKLVLGHSNDATRAKADLDLTPFGALKKSVSQTHAAICRNQNTLTLIDMGSANGTYLNGQRIIPHQPRILRNGDDIRMGMLVAHIYFNFGDASLTYVF